MRKKREAGVSIKVCRANEIQWELACLYYR
jgi:hypothetical protein